MTENDPTGILCNGFHSLTSNKCGYCRVMPNTLAHFGIQGLLTRTAVPGADLKWVYLACVLPDVPWIIQRLGQVLLPASWFVDLRLYVIVQASFLFCCLLAGALAIWSDLPRRTFGILVLGAFLHLLLDAAQTKWGNGVHLFAPVSWDLLNFEWYWPEEAPTLLLTAFGLGFVFFMLWKVPIHHADLRIPTRRSFVMGAVCLFLYFVSPFVFFSGPENADNHSIRTLKEIEARTGKEFEVDRQFLLVRDHGKVLTTFTGEELVVRGYDGNAFGVVSAKGVFVNPITVELTEIHLHAGRLRDLPSYLGIAFLSLIWAWAIYARLKLRQQGGKDQS